MIGRIALGGGIAAAAAGGLGWVIARRLTATAGPQVTIGHTDNQGKLDYNLSLSQRRAEAVVTALSTTYKVARTRLVGKGVANLAPVASNQSDEGRAKNRRVELVLQ